jgi:putative colanic acid biosynthesis acetyltransferase WcaF
MNIEANRDVTKYSRKVQAMRLCWGLARVVFQCSPRPCFGFRRWLLKLFGAEIGKNVHIYPSAHIYFPWNLKIGDWSSIGEWSLIYNLGPVTIGARSTVSQRTHVCAGTHDYRDPAMPLIKSPISIGDEVWICADAFVGPGVHVGDGAVVGARAVVVKDVAAWNVVAGNPARLLHVRSILPASEHEFK